MSSTAPAPKPERKSVYNSPRALKTFLYVALWAMMSLSPSPTGVVFTWSQTLTQITIGCWTQRLKMVCGGNVAKQACE